MIDQPMTTGEKAAALCLVPVIAAWRGFVLSKMWLWFVAHALGAPSIDFAEAIGLSVIFSLLTHEIRSVTKTLKEEDSKTAWTCYVGYGLFVPLLLLGSAWIAHQFQ